MAKPRPKRYVPERPQRGSEGSSLKKPRVVAMKQMTCQDCKDAYEGHPSSRYCSFCSTDDLKLYKRERAQQDALLLAERQRANDRIDRLEALLRSRGLHLSQQTK